MKYSVIGTLLLLSCLSSELLLPPTARATSAVGPVLKGHLARLSGDAEGSQTAFKEAVKVDPDSPELRSMAAQSLAAGRKLAPALELVEEGLRRDPQQGGLLLLRAKLLEALGRREEAVGATRAAVSKSTGSDAHALLVALLGTLGREKEALEAAREWAAAFPKSTDAQFALGYVLLQVGERQGALEALDRVLAEVPYHYGALRSRAALEATTNREAAVSMYRRVLELNPHDIDSAVQLAKLLLELGRAEEATSLFQKADSPDRPTPNASVRLAMLLAQAEKPGEVEVVLEQLVKLHPETPRLWFLLGVIRQNRGNSEGAIEAYEKVPPAAAEFPEGAIRRAFALDALKRNAEALALVTSQMEAHPEDETIALVFAELVETEQDQRKAVEFLQRFVNRDTAAKAQIYFTLGALCDKLKDWKKGAEYIKQSLALRPDDAQALNYLGYTYADHGVNLDEAERLITRALELKPNEGYITDSLGWVYYKQRRYPDAVLKLKRAVELSPKDAVIWDHLGDACRAAGDANAAREAYGRATELDPTYAPAREKLSELKP